MAIWYILRPGVRVQVGRDGGPFGKPVKLKAQVNFPAPVASEDTTMTFDDGPAGCL